MEYKISNSPTAQEKDTIRQALLKYNCSRIESMDIRELGVFLEDEQGSIIAGVTGYTHGNWLEIEYLWVNEGLRGKNIGRELIGKIETIARGRDCKFAFLYTFTFQAPQFYKNLGYEEKFVLNEYPLTGQKHYYSKNL